MKKRVSELEGAMLDAAVAKVEGVRVRYFDDVCVCYQGGDDTGMKERRGPHYNPSRNWANGGPIIEREWIGLDRGRLEAPPEERWWADAGAPKASVECGPTALIAAMRAFVASKLGNEVELEPDQ